MRADYGADHLYTEMAEAALAGWDGWNARWQTPLYHEDGFVVLASEPMAPGGFEYESFESLRLRGHPVERLTGVDRASIVPAWSPIAYPDGYLNRRAGWVESGAVVTRVADEARSGRGANRGEHHVQRAAAGVGPRDERAARAKERFTPRTSSWSLQERGHQSCCRT